MQKHFGKYLVTIFALLLSSATWGQARSPELKGLQQFDVDLSSISEQCGVSKRALGQALKSALETSQIRFATEKKGPRIQLSSLSRHMPDLNVCAVEVALEVRASVQILPTNQRGIAVVWSDRRLVLAAPSGMPPRVVQAVKEMGKELAKDWGDVN